MNNRKAIALALVAFFVGDATAIARARIHEKRMIKNWSIESDIQQLKINTLVEAMQSVVNAETEEDGDEAIDKFLEAKKFIDTLEDSM